MNIILVNNIWQQHNEHLRIKKELPYAFYSQDKNMFLFFIGKMNGYKWIISVKSKETKG